MTKGNNAIPKVHQRKHFGPASAQKGNVKTFLDQPKQKQRRRRLRLQKAKRIFPRPLKALRPSVACPTVRYNFRKRLGRGFTVEEIKAAGITPRYASTIGIRVDLRRKNISEESLSSNTQRLKTYISKLVLYPIARKAGKSTPSKKQAPEASAADIKLGVQDRLGKVVSAPKDEKKARAPARKLTKKETTDSAYKQLKKAISSVRFLGERMLRAKKKEEKAKAAAEKKAAAAK
jgi:large subunit ribosomal protein L13e